MWYGKGTRNGNVVAKGECGARNGNVAAKGMWVWEGSYE